MKDVLVLCYHAVSERWPSELAVTPDLLERQVGFLRRRGYRTTTFTNAVTAPPWPRTLALTFDDAYRSTLELAFPVLERLGVKAAVYAPTAFVGSHEPMSWPGIEQWVEGPYRAELACMSWEELGELAERGWEVGSHSRSHPRLPDVDDVALADELSGSREELAARLGRCESLAYPYGAADGRVVEAARRAGYRTAGTLTRRAHAAGPLHWPRVGVYPANPALLFGAKTSSRLRWLDTRLRRLGSVNRYRG